MKYTSLSFFVCVLLVFVFSTVVLKAQPYPPSNNKTRFLKAAR